MAVQKYSFIHAGKSAVLQIQFIGITIRRNRNCLIFKNHRQLFDHFNSSVFGYLR